MKTIPFKVFLAVYIVLAIVFILFEIEEPHAAALIYASMASSITSIPILLTILIG